MNSTLTQEQQKLLDMLRKHPEDLGKRYTPRQAADYLQVIKESTLATWRTNEPDKIPFFRTGVKGGRVLYFQFHLDQFLAKQMQGI